MVKTYETLPAVGVKTHTNSLNPEYSSIVFMDGCNADLIIRWCLTSINTPKKWHPEIPRWSTPLVSMCQTPSAVPSEPPETPMNAGLQSQPKSARWTQDKPPWRARILISSLCHGSNLNPHWIQMISRVPHLKVYVAVSNELSWATLQL